MVRGARSALPLAPRDFHILLALAGGPSHGYAIWQTLEDQACEGIRVELGSLYRLISRLLDSGLIEEAREVEQPSHAGRPRRSYRLTELGLAALRAETRRLRELVRTAEGRLLADAAGR